MITRPHHDAQGFTLVELLMVVLIIGLLASIVIPVYSGARNGAYDAGSVSDIRTSMDSFVQDQVTGDGTVPSASGVASDIQTAHPSLGTTSAQNTAATLVAKQVTVVGTPNPQSVTINELSPSGDLCATGFYASRLDGPACTAITAPPLSAGPIGIGSESVFGDPGQVNNLSEEAVSANGYLWSGDEGTNNIVRFDPITGAVKTFQVPTSNAGVTFGFATGPDGNIWFTEFNAGKVGKINPNTGQITEYPLSNSAYEPYFITLGPDGNLWFTVFNSSAHGIEKINPSTGVITAYNQSAGWTDGTPWPEDIVTGPDGNLWFTTLDTGTLKTGLGRITPTGTVSEFHPSGAVSLWEVVAGADGNLWVTDEYGIPGSVYKISTNGTQLADYTFPGSPSVQQWPDAMTLGPDNNIWIFTAMSSPNYAYQYTSSGSVTAYPLGQNAANYSNNSNNIYSGGAIIGPDNNIWLTARGIDRFIP